jgi:inner membrane protein
MPTFLSHPAVPLAMSAWLGRSMVSVRLLAVAGFLSAVPDLDVVAFLFRIPYESPWGHRGFTHSFAFAAIVAGLSARYAFGRSRFAFAFLFAAMASHGVLDAFTNGGLGVAFFWPFLDTRYFFPWRPIEVSPIGAGFFQGDRGVHVLVSEFLWVWLPCAALGALGWLSTRRRGA